MLKHIIVDIRRSETTTVRKDYPTWEIPVLKAVHGEDNVTEVGDRLVDRNPPEAADEFQRLAERYRRSRSEDGSLALPYVALVYGQMGVQRLEAAIRAAVTEAPEGSLVDGGEEQNSSVGG